MKEGDPNLYGQDLPYTAEERASMSVKRYPVIPGLEEANRKLAEMTPEKKAKFVADLAAKAAERKKDDEDQRWKRGKYDPKNHPVGWCVACRLESVVEKWQIHYRGELVLGGPSNAAMRRVGYYCRECGLTYEFAVTEPPPDHL